MMNTQVDKMAPVYNIFTKEKIEIKYSQPFDDAEKWGTIADGLNKILEKYMEEKTKPHAIILGVEEYSCCMRFHIKTSDKFECPRSYKGVPIILVPMRNFCCIVARPDDMWQQFVP